MKTETRVERSASEAEEQRDRIDKLAESISGLCHAVIARRLGQFFEVIGEEVEAMQSRGPVTREQAIEIARRCAKAKPESYYAEPFQPHEWVIDAIREASRG
jgi:hypothetical protein